jgi:hypothetical protein
VLLVDLFLFCLVAAALAGLVRLAVRLGLPELLKGRGSSLRKLLIMLRERR